jgi:hypothetical protein
MRRGVSGSRSQFSPPGLRAAILAGFALAAICAAGSFSSSDAAAQNFFEDLFGSFPEHRYQRAYPSAGRQARAKRTRPGWTSAAPPSAARIERSRYVPAALPERGLAADQPGGLQSYCVRDCDGYFFPVGVYSGSADTAAHQRACSSLCPGARTTLFILRNGSDKIEDAVAARGGRSAYSRLTASLRRRGETGKSESCSCHSGAEESPASAILHDPTLRRGDVVMTTHGVEVFRGGGRFPYSARDFHPLRQTGDISPSLRRKLTALERASRPESGQERRVGGLDEHRSESARRSRRSRH